MLATLILLSNVSLYLVRPGFRLLHPEEVYRLFTCGQRFSDTYYDVRSPVRDRSSFLFKPTPPHSLVYSYSTHQQGKYTMTRRRRGVAPAANAPAANAPAPNAIAGYIKSILIFVSGQVITVAGFGLVLYNDYNESNEKQYQKEYGPGTQYHLDEMLKNIVTADYHPEGPEYINRDHDTHLKERLKKYIERSDTANGFFMLIGESGSGKTTMMRHRLKEDYKEGVLEVTLTASKILDRIRKKADPVDLQIEEMVLQKFGKCWNHEAASADFLDFVARANKVRMEAKKAEQVENAHPLIIYITLESKKDLDYQTMIEFADGFSSVATVLSSKTNSCKTIVEFSKTAISDHVIRLRTSDKKSFEVNAMTEEEFLKIGPQFLGEEDPQKLQVPYLKHYHNWLGGHTKTLVGLGERVEEKSMYRFCGLCTIIINHALSSQLRLPPLTQGRGF